MLLTSPLKSIVLSVSSKNTLDTVSLMSAMQRDSLNLFSAARAFK